ncbi:MAG: glycosyltransferase [Thermoanaerobaculia bacterium]
MPVRNEVAFILRGLESVLAQDYPADRMEVLVADGMSTDGTRQIVKTLQEVDPRIRLVDNPGLIVPTGLNAAIRESRGEIVIRVDGHCEIARDYVLNCVQHLLSGEADAVGGSVTTVGIGTRAEAIARAMSSIFGVGTSKFRTVQGRNLLVDTVAFPAYKRDLLDSAGPFDEEFVRNQDDEYNYRLLEQGAKILLAADVQSRYYCRGSITSLARQYFQYGFWKVRVMQKHARQMRLRQFAPPFFVAFVLSSALLAAFSRFTIPFLVLALCYLTADVAASVITARQGGARLFPWLILTFPAMHFSYGIGFWVGLARFGGRRRERAFMRDAPTTGLRLAKPLSGRRPGGQRILIVTQFYPPETGAPQNRLSDLAGRLSENGNEVTVLTAMPNYPLGRVFERYRGKLVLEERRDDIRVIRTWIQVRPSSGFRGRLATYWSFMITGFVLGLPRLGRQDVVLVESPPLFLGLTGFAISKLRRAKFVLNVSDLWPESAVAMRILRGRLLIRLSEWLEAFLYRHADLITGQTRGIVTSILTRFPDKAVALVTNGVDVERFALTSLSDRDEIRQEMGVSDQFVVGYAGLHGLAQRLETVLECAELLKARKDIAFVFVGSGPERDRLVRRQQEAGLTNVRFVANQPAQRVPSILAAFDAALIPLRKLDLFRGALPSKLFEAMASGVPLVLSVEGEAKDLVTAANAGLCVEPENPQAMAAAILRLVSDPALRRTFAESGRRYVVLNYDRRLIGQRVDRLLRGEAADYGREDPELPERQGGSA